ncbi:MAG: response regulator transcription factor [Spirochaetota bacterium]|nr:response regulator transcription factor [Spirochaetota bacterium]
MTAEMPDSDKIKVCIVEDEKPYRDLVKAMLEEDKRIWIYGEYENGLDFVNTLGSPFQPDVCLIDLRLPDMSGIDIAQKVSLSHPSVHVIILTGYSSIESLAEAKDLGIDYIEKGTRGVELINKIIARGKSLSEHEQLLSLRKSDSHNIVLLAEKLSAIQNNVQKLSVQQVEVLKCRQKGMTINDVAIHLHMKPSTVRTHIDRATKKLGFSKLLDFIKLDN